MTPDEHNPEGTDHAAQGHYLAASRTTPPAPTPTLPPEVREAIADAMGYRSEEAALNAKPFTEPATYRLICAALAPLWPRPAPVTADARELAERIHKAVFAGESHPDAETDAIAAVLAPVLRERDELRAEVLRLQGIASTNADQLATAERVLDAYRVQLAEAKQEVERLTGVVEARIQEIKHGWSEYDRLRAQLADARQAVAAALADKERLDWLEANLCYAMVAPDGIHMTQLASPHGKGWQNGNLRIALDTARREGGAQ